MCYVFAATLGPHLCFFTYSRRYSWGVRPPSLSSILFVLKWLTALSIISTALSAGILSSFPITSSLEKRAYHNGTELRNLLPLWQRGRTTMPSRRQAERVLRKMALHNGTELRNLLPLWQRGRTTMPSRRQAERVRRRMALHNGTELRNLLPLRFHSVPARERK